MSKWTVNLRTFNIHEERNLLSMLKRQQIMLLRWMRTRRWMEAVASNKKFLLKIVSYGEEKKCSAAQQFPKQKQ